ncbi:MAG: hypothetical protein ACI4IF_04515 [Acutalibacteraceae bacterium]
MEEKNVISENTNEVKKEKSGFAFFKNCSETLKRLSVILFIINIFIAISLMVVAVVVIGVYISFDMLSIVVLPLVCLLVISVVLARFISALVYGFAEIVEKYEKMK